MSKNNNFTLADKENISNTHLFDDGLNLGETSRFILANSVIDCLKKFQLTSLHHPNRQLYTLH